MRHYLTVIPHGSTTVITTIAKIRKSGIIMIGTDFPPLIKKALAFMPGLVSSLDLALEEREALILALMILYGGTITKNELVEFLNITRPTRDKYVYQLLNKELIIQNEAVVPVRLTLMSHILEQLRSKLEEIKQSFEKDKLFLITLSAQLPEIMPSKLDPQLKERLIVKTRKAIRSLLFAQPYEDLIRETLIQIYKKLLESGKPLIALSALKRALKKQGYVYPREGKIVLRSQRMFRLFSFTQPLPVDKQKMKSTHEEVFIRPRIPLDAIIESLARDTKRFLEEYEELLGEIELAEVRPQILQDRRWIKNKLRLCLSTYPEVFIWENGAYAQRYKSKGRILDLINDSESFTNKHKLWILTNRELEVPEEIEEQVITYLLPKDIAILYPNYVESDLILFLKEGVAYGCIKFPLDRRLKPYYDVTQHRVNAVKDLFRQLWRKAQLSAFGGKYSDI